MPPAPSFTTGGSQASTFVPPVRDGYGPSVVPIAWENLKFGPLGLYDLGAVWNHRKQFLAADVAWFAGGASTDGNHIPVPDSYFHEFDDLRQMLPTGTIGNEARRALHERMQHVVFDLATLWDRAFGGSTMIMQSRAPLSPIPRASSVPPLRRLPPPSFVANNPPVMVHRPNVQTFIEAVGVPTVNKWRSNGNRRGWPSISQVPSASAHYKFHGRPIGVLDEILAASAPVPVVVIPDDDEDIFDSSGDDILTVLERLGYAEAESRDRLTGSTTSRSKPRFEHCFTQCAHPSHSLCAKYSAPFSASPPHSRTSTGTPALFAIPHPFAPHVPTRRFGASPSRHAYDQVDLDTFITSHGLDNHAASIRMVMRAFHAAKWSEELVQLGIPDEILSTLLEVMSAV
ncbi:hypothetical protein B0H10DRAFT_2237192 [Mycena sp. CBHHK59/15]|nr:hypothetical protein B0H10DRAFT_2237192 [Mycena sp. CBHHK59/15]